MDSVLQFFSQSGKVFNSLPPSKRVSILFVVVITLVSIGAFVIFMNQKEYRVLFSNLATGDAGEIVARLQETKTPYKLSFAGDSISVPSDYVSKLRLDLAASGLPKGGGVGFEIFDTNKFGATEFEQRLNYQRALQGELSRTINGLDEIQSSRVHIVIPQKSFFAEEAMFLKLCIIPCLARSIPSAAVLPEVNASLPHFFNAPAESTPALSISAIASVVFLPFVTKYL